MGKRLLFVGNGIDLLTGCGTTYGNFISKYINRAEYLVGKKLKDAKKIRFLNSDQDYDEVKKELEKIDIKYLEEAKSLYFYPPYEIFNLHKESGEIWYHKFGCIYWDVKSSEVIDKKYEFLYELLDNCKEKSKSRAVINGCFNNEFHNRDILMKEVNFTYRQEGKKYEELYKLNKKCYELAYKEEKKIELNIFIFTFILVKWNVIGVDKYIDADIENWGDLEYFIKEMARDDSLLIDVSEEFDIPYKNQKDKSFDDLKLKLSQFIEEQEKLNDKIKVSEKVSSLLEASKVINFNYKGNPLIEKNKKPEDIFYVHGKYQEKEKIILGFDESANKSLSTGENKYKTDMIHMSKIFQYTLSYGNDKKEVSELVKKYWDTVAVIGHSISESDYSYFFNILDRNLDNLDFKIELLYYEYKSGGKTVTNEYNLLKSFVQMLRAYEVYSGKECMNMLYEGKLVKRLKYDYSNDFEIV